MDKINATFAHVARAFDGIHGSGPSSREYSTNRVELENCWPEAEKHRRPRTVHYMFRASEVKGYQCALCERRST